MEALIITAGLLYLGVGFVLGCIASGATTTDPLNKAGIFFIIFFFWLPAIIMANIPERFKPTNWFKKNSEGEEKRVESFIIKSGHNVRFFIL